MNQEVYSDNKELPSISIIMSAFNEEAVVEEKITSVYHTSYPLSKIEFLIGSDASLDNTNQIISSLTGKCPGLLFFPYTQRRGKGNVINELVSKATNGILVLTDANIIFNRDTLFELIKHFKNDKVGLVDTRMQHSGKVKDGISIQESFYISGEVLLKNMESKWGGCMMGPFGGCFAMRRELFQPVPSNFLVDDFYINMKVLEKGYLAINNMKAVVHEDVSNNMKDEFRRKARISAGNFQNMVAFYKMWLNLFKKKGFCFFSHKILRWIGPFLLLFLLLSGFMLRNRHELYLGFFVLQSGTLFLSFTDLFLRKIGLHVVFLRFLTHFYATNLALLAGFYKVIKGVKSNVWQPTKRYQSG
ncbi:MAG: glycosyltransferase [Bacteroidota bacterium]